MKYTTCKKNAGEGFRVKISNRFEIKNKGELLHCIARLYEDLCDDKFRLKQCILFKLDFG